MSWTGTMVLIGQSTSAVQGEQWSMYRTYTRPPAHPYKVRSPTIASPDILFIRNSDFDGVLFQVNRDNLCIARTTSTFLRMNWVSGLRPWSNEIILTKNRTVCEKPHIRFIPSFRLAFFKKCNRNWRPAQYRCAGQVLWS